MPWMVGNGRWTSEGRREHIDVVRPCDDAGFPMPQCMQRECEERCTTEGGLDCSGRPHAGRQMTACACGARCILNTVGIPRALSVEQSALAARGYIRPGRYSAQPTTSQSCTDESARRPRRETVPSVHVSAGWVSEFGGSVCHLFASSATTRQDSRVRKSFLPSLSPPP